MFDSVATQLGRARDESARELLTYAAAPHQQVLARSATKTALLDLVSEAEDGGWTTRRACCYLELSQRRLERWRRRVADGVGLDDAAPGGNPTHGLTPAEEDEIVAVFNE